MTPPKTLWRDLAERLWELLIETHCKLFHRHHPETEEASIPLPVLHRQWLYDFHIANPELYATALGLPPYSAEGAEHARLESDKRLARIESLLPLLVEQGEWMAKVMVYAGISAQDIDASSKHAALENYRHLFVHNCMSLAATLADMGVLRVDG